MTPTCTIPVQHIQTHTQPYLILCPKNRAIHSRLQSKQNKRLHLHQQMYQLSRTFFSSIRSSSLPFLVVGPHLGFRLCYTAGLLNFNLGPYKRKWNHGVVGNQLNVLSLLEDLFIVNHKTWTKCISDSYCPSTFWRGNTQECPCLCMRVSVPFCVAIRDEGLPADLAVDWRGRHFPS